MHLVIACEISIAMLRSLAARSEKQRSASAELTFLI
jgi:hypothetical protein